MDELEALLEQSIAEAPTSVSTVSPRPCRRHQWVESASAMGEPIPPYCRTCGHPKDAVRSRAGRNNRKRGNAAELDVAREVGGRKVGPLGHPWDVEMPGYARLQVKKLKAPPSLRFIAAELARIARAPGEEMPGFAWVEPGRGGERLIVFRLADFAERHGIVTEEEAA
jgi:hypothetical protein